MLSEDDPEWNARRCRGAHQGTFYIILDLMGVDDQWPEDAKPSFEDFIKGPWPVKNSSRQKLFSMYKVLEQHREDCARDPSLDPNAPPLDSIDYTLEEARLFLEALDRLHEVACEAEAYHNMPACTLL